MTDADAKLTELLKPIAEAIAKNCGTVPQLTSPHLFLGVKDLLQNPEFTALNRIPSQGTTPTTTKD